MTKTSGRWRGHAPSNIALIKYMGKLYGAAPVNRPTNSSLSYTLNHLRTHLELELLSDAGGEDRWAPLKETGLTPIQLSEKGRDRFLRHLAFLKAKWDFKGSFLVRSANDFPSDCGLASSASSFAALTSVAANALVDLTGRELPQQKEKALADLSDWSRQGSGSSCRSFFEPWSIWSESGAASIELPQTNLIHQVIIVEDSVKSVSSSEAHKRVASSLLFQGRPERAELRLQHLLQALRHNKWQEAMQICWAEFWDMHALFETAAPPFGYMTSGSLAVLSYLRDEIWSREGDGPIVTMDAGANIHVLYRPEMKAIAARVCAHFQTQHQVIQSPGGIP